MNPQPTPAPLNDIVGPLALEKYPLPLMIGLAVLLVGLVLLAVWFYGARGRRTPPTAGAIARAALAALRNQQASAYEFGVRVSDILRRYIRDRHGLDAVNMTSTEFLQSLRGTAAFREEEKIALAAFLEASDLLKYARAEAASEELGRLFETADNLVKAGEQTPKKQKAKGAR